VIMKTIYCDANATTRLDPEVLQEMMPFLTEKYGNPSSIHALGRDAKKYLSKARRQVVALIQAESPEEIVFTSGGTESDNLAIKGTAERLKEKGGHIITSSVEHSAVLNTCRALNEKGYKVTYLKVDEFGLIDPDELREKIGEKTILVTIMTANNETGTILPVEEISSIASAQGVLFHTDAVQAAGKIPVTVKGKGVDMISLSSHKINGPKGVGALYVKEGTKISALHSGGYQESGRRAGTENLAGIVGFGKACEVALKNLDKRSLKTKKLRDMLFEGIKEHIGGAELNGHISERLPNTLNISFRGIEGESLVRAMDLEGIYAGAGSACKAGSPEASHVLEAMGLSPERVRSAVRFSVDKFNSEEDISEIIRKLPGIVSRIRDL